LVMMVSGCSYTNSADRRSAINMINRHGAARQDAVRIAKTEL
jgi:hypothetical protein